MEFKQGDVVQLKSGGPLMTITSVENTAHGPRAWTVWFHDGKEQTGAYPLATLVAEKDNEEN
jgi:uncharacterized protein YodC (DUF2158 family)